MKNFLVYILIIGSIKCFGQEPNSNLFQVWYLSSVIPNDGGQEPFFPSDLDYPETPFLNIFENLTFQGRFYCNTFEGTFISSSAASLETVQFSNSSEECGNEEYNMFKDGFYGILQGVSQYSISSDINGLVLTLNMPSGGQAVFTNYGILNISDQSLDRIKIFPIDRL